MSTVGSTVSDSGKTPQSRVPRDRAGAAGSCTVVIFGASGDLTERKLLPALWNLFCENRLPPKFAIVGFARSPLETETFRGIAHRAICDASRTPDPDPDLWDRFCHRLHYVRGSYDDPSSYQVLQETLEHLASEEEGGHSRLFYLATPPSAYEQIVLALGQTGLARQRGDLWARVVVEKPFGSNGETARHLDATLQSVFDESQIYRIDHYLGKETVQNLLVLRFANAIFEPVWNRQYVEQVHISVTESLGVEGRGPNYDQVGALRDMIQNHLMQLLCLVAMEAPASLQETAVRNEKVKVLDSIRPLRLDQVAGAAVRAQYGRGVVSGRTAPSYLEEKGVAPESSTESFAALRLCIDNWRWAGVPFFLRSGKRLHDRRTVISVVFRQAPHLLFEDFSTEPQDRNVLCIRIQPEEKIELRFGVKVPRAVRRIRAAEMEFDFKERFGQGSPEAYERLLLDCMRGDVTLFSRNDWIAKSWDLMDPILEVWGNDRTPLPTYPAGTWGPTEADELIRAAGLPGWIQ